MTRLLDAIAALIEGGIPRSEGYDQVHWHTCNNCGHIWSHKASEIVERTGAHSCKQCPHGQDFYRKDTYRAALEARAELRKRQHIEDTKEP